LSINLEQSAHGANRNKLKTLKITYLFLLLFCSTIVNAQGAFIDANNVKAWINPSAALFHNPNTFGPGYEYPINSNKHTMFISSPWIAAIDSSGWLLVAAEQYGFGNQDFQSGPVMDSIHYPLEVPNWEKVWKVRRADIEAFKDWFNNPSGFPSYTIHNSILEWPAHGDISKGQNFNLAPFFDNNGDGFYNPLDGDYPLIKCDQGLWWVFNDDLVLFPGGNLKIEIQAMAHECGCTQDTALRNTVFIDYKIINRSSKTWYDAYFGQWTDGDIGCSEDDYIGSDPFRSCYYFYNADSLDNNGCGGSTAYYANHPAQGVVMLAGPHQDTDGTDNPIDTANNGSYTGTGYGDGIIDNERLGMAHGMYMNRSGTGLGAWNADPNFGIDYYNYLRGVWLDGTRLVYGGTGHTSDPGASSFETTFSFPGTSDTTIFWGTDGIPVSEWSEESEGNPLGDRRFVGSMGPFTMIPGQEEEINLAFVSAIDSSGAQNSVGLLLNRVDEIISRFNNDSIDCFSPVTSVPTYKKNWFEFSTYPNPNNGKFKIEFTRTTPNLQIEIFDINGRRIFTQYMVTMLNSIDLKDSPSGVYLVKISDEKQTDSRRIVVDR